MAFDKTQEHKRKKSIPNSLQDYPVISFKTNLLSPQNISYLKHLADDNQRGSYICNAIYTRFKLQTDPFNFYVELFQENLEFFRKALTKANRLSKANTLSVEEERNLKVARQIKEDWGIPLDIGMYLARATRRSGLSVDEALENERGWVVERIGESEYNVLAERMGCVA